VDPATVDLNTDVTPTLGVETTDLSGAPGCPCWLAAVDPLSTVVVGHSEVGEGEHAVLTAGRAAAGRAGRRAGGRGRRGGGGGG